MRRIRGLQQYQLGGVLALMLLLTGMTTVSAEELEPEVKVAEPFIELHTGPGIGYPVFYVVDRGEFVEVLKRRTDWFKVRYRRSANPDVEGWVSRAQMEKTLAPTGKVTRFAEAVLDDFTGRRWELGLVGGEFNSAPVMTLYSGYALTQNLSAELSVSQVLGDFSSSVLANFNLLLQPFPRQRYSPFFTLGVGQIDTSPKTTLVQVADRSDFIAHAGAGLKVYLTRQFILRIEYKNYVGFSSDDDNEEFEEWKAGFAFFF
jgi:hypothetical protein